MVWFLWACLVHAAINAVYSAWMVFVVLRPEGMKPGSLLGAKALHLLDTEKDRALLVQRRSYASEHWQSMGQVAIALGFLAMLGW